MPKELKELVGNLPTMPGVYLMKDEGGKVIYIGKAKNLKNRVKNYFQKSSDTRYQIKFLIKKVVDIETIIAGTEEQAFMLERDLIKKHKPRYNIRLKDDKNFLSIRIDENQEWPRLEYTRKIENDGAIYFGPYTFSHELKELMEIIKQTIPLRTCSDTILYNRQRPCLEYQIKRCCAPCCLKIEPEEYRDYLKEAIDILKGNVKDIVKQFEKKMELASSDLRFEDAATFRDKIELLKNFKKGQKYISTGTENRDVFSLYREESLAIISLLKVRNGRISGSVNHKFTEVDLPDEEVLQSIIEQYYDNGAEIPEEIVLNVEIDSFYLNTLIKRITGKKISLTIPKTGLKKRLLSLAELNAKQHFDLSFNSAFKTLEILNKLALLFKLKQVPRRIESVDISNLQASDIVGAIVSFYDGKPDKDNYRKFKISQQDKPDDFNSMYEVLYRRIKAGMIDDNLPDLFIIDGGKPQLEKALAAAADLKVDIEMIALAKEKSFKGEKRPERIYLAGKDSPILLNKHKDIMNFLVRIRDEVHRFVITYHRSSRSRRVFKSILDEIPGIGPERKKRLLKAYGSVANMKKVSAEELAEVGKMSLGLAKELLRVIN